MLSKIIGGIWIILGLAVWGFLNKRPLFRYFTLGLSFTYLGIFMGGGFSINDVMTLLSWHVPVFLNNLYWYSLVAIAVGLTIFAGRFYCGWLCPFGAFLELLYRVPIQLKISAIADRLLKSVKYVNFLILVLIAFVLANNVVAVYLAGVIEPFATFYELHGDVISWTWLMMVLAGSIAIPRFYCRYFCPLGAFFALVSGLSALLGVSLAKVELPGDDCKGCRLAEKECQMSAINYREKLNRPQVSRSECIMCNSCAEKCPARKMENQDVEQ